MMKGSDVFLPYVFFEDQVAGRRRLYENPREIITAQTADDVEAALARMTACQAQGFYLAGYCAYELGYVFEEKLRPRLPQNIDGPLLQFGVFDKFSESVPHIHTHAGISNLTPDWDIKAYQKRFDKVLKWIRAGDVYQVNLTFGMRGNYTGDAAAIYGHLKAAQPVRYGGVVCLGGADIVSLSPELFFETGGGKISMRPMKGTSARGTMPVQDGQLAQALQGDAKNRAENLMIVDLLRNDVSRIAKAGSVKVTDLFSIETYPSLHTMTSGIEARLQDVSITDILRALFPCGSVTGAPKIRAMEIIRVLEDAPRDVYCGALGLIDPDGYMRFNVGIRTLNLAKDGRFSYGVGSGLVADSVAQDEYLECLLKASFLQNNYGLIETFGWHEQTGFMWLDLHLARLVRSAEALGFTYTKSAVLKALEVAVRPLSGPQKIRLELSKDGSIAAMSAPLKLANPDNPWGIVLSKNPVASGDTFLAHKTTRRQFIDAEFNRLKAATGCQEMLLLNEREEICEGNYTNVFVVKAGQMLTPPTDCGLLPGVLRQALLSSKQARERILTIDDLVSADEIYVGNSVRGLVKAKLLSPRRQ